MGDWTETGEKESRAPMEKASGESGAESSKGETIPKGERYALSHGPRTRSAGSFPETEPAIGTPSLSTPGKARYATQARRRRKPNKSATV